MNSINKRLEELETNPSITPVVVANYVPFCFVDHLLMISGRLPMKNDQVALKEKVEKDPTLEEDQQDARLCALNILTHLQAALEGDWKRLKCCVLWVVLLIVAMILSINLKLLMELRTLW